MQEEFRQLHRPAQESCGASAPASACGASSITARSSNLGGITHHLVPQKELADLANPFYNQFARGGEGHLEVGKNVYYTVHKMCHMVLALKPFGCMPSSQSDGVQSAVINKFKDMIFLPIETSGEGEVNAHSRVQMALGEAKVKAKTEFEQCLKSTGKTMNEIRGYIDEHPELRRPFYHVPHREGVAGTAAQFILHVNDRIDRDTRFWKKSRVRVEAGRRSLGRLNRGDRRAFTDELLAAISCGLCNSASSAVREFDFDFRKPERNSCTTIRVRS